MSASEGSRTSSAAYSTPGKRWSSGTSRRSLATKASIPRPCVLRAASDSTRRLPSAIPQFFTGLKVAVTYSYVAAIVAEFVGAQQGLGVYMTTAKNAFRTDLVFGAVIVTSLLTLALFVLVVALERLAMPWRQPAARRVDW